MIIHTSPVTKIFYADTGITKYQTTVEIGCSLSISSEDKYYSNIQILEYLENTLNEELTKELLSSLTVLEHFLYSTIKQENFEELKEIFNNIYDSITKVKVTKDSL